MALIFVLFLFPDFIKADRINIESNSEINNQEKISIKEKSRISFLKEIPRTKVSIEEKNSLSTRNPFLPIGQSIGGESVLKFSEIDLNGIAIMNGNYVAFIKTSKGTNPYKIGEIIGSDFKLLSIDNKNLTIEIGNDLTTHLVTLREDLN